MNEEQIKHMVSRFLGWKLPKDFRPDNGISYSRPNYSPSYDATPNGTNLFDSSQAELMVRHMVEGLPESWLDYPVNVPKQFDKYVAVSNPVLFLTEDVGDHHIRLGYYKHDDGCFYESGDDNRLPWKHTVTRFMPIPYPQVMG